MNSKTSPKKKCLIIMLALLIVTSKDVNADFTFGMPTKVQNVNSSSDDGNPDISADGLMLFFSSYRPPGYGNSDIWVTTRVTTYDLWGNPMNVGPPINSSAYEGSPSISVDGLCLYFTSDRAGGSGNRDLWVTTRATTNDPWQEPVNLGPEVNSSSADGDPEISSDSLVLFFGSDRSGGYGHYDLYMTTRATTSDSWESPVNLGPTVNDSHYDGDPEISTDGLSLFFSSYRAGGYGEVDLWMTTRTTISDLWEPPMNLGSLVNGSKHDTDPTISALSPTLYFGRETTHYDIWQAPIRPVVDLNGDGIVDAVDMCIVVDYWSTDNKLCDVGPIPWGDGVVDVHDLIVLAEHLFEENFPPELIAYWKLDEEEGDTAHDSIEGNDGFGPPDLLWRPEDGIVGGALELDGIDDSIVTTFSLNPAQTSFSAFAWIKGGGPEQVALSQNNGVNWLLADSEGQLMTALRRGSSGPTLASEYIITDGDWHHIGVVWDKSHRHLYADGIEVAEDTNNLGYLSSSNGNLCIGCGNAFDTGSFFSGMVDDIRIYNVALSPEKIAALAQ